MHAGFRKGRGSRSKYIGSMTPLVPCHIKDDIPLFKFKSQESADYLIETLEPHKGDIPLFKSQESADYLIETLEPHKDDIPLFKSQESADYLIETLEPHVQIPRP